MGGLLSRIIFFLLLLLVPALITTARPLPLPLRPREDVPPPVAWKSACLVRSEQSGAVLMSFSIDLVDGRAVPDIGFAVPCQLTGPVTVECKHDHDDLLRKTATVAGNLLFGDGSRWKDTPERWLLCEKSPARSLVASFSPLQGLDGPVGNGGGPYGLFSFLYGTPAPVKFGFLAGLVFMLAIVGHTHCIMKLRARCRRNVVTITAGDRDSRRIRGDIKSPFSEYREKHCDGFFNSEDEKKEIMKCTEDEDRENFTDDDDSCDLSAEITHFIEAADMVSEMLRAAEEGRVSVMTRQLEREQCQQSGVARQQQSDEVAVEEEIPPTCEDIHGGRR